MEVLRVGERENKVDLDVEGSMSNLKCWPTVSKLLAVSFTTLTWGRRGVQIVMKNVVFGMGGFKWFCKTLSLKIFFETGDLGKGTGSDFFSGGPTWVFSVAFVVRLRDLNLLGSLFGFLRGWGAGTGTLCNVWQTYPKFLIHFGRWSDGGRAKT